MQNFLNLVKEKCQNTKILGIVGAILLIVGNFFTYAKVSIFGIKEGISFIEVAGGKILVILGVLNLVLVFKELIKPKIPANILEKIKIIDNTKVILVPTIISVIVILIANGEIFDYGIAKPSFGCYVLWIGIILSAVYPFIFKEKNNTEIK